MYWIGTFSRRILYWISTVRSPWVEKYLSNRVDWINGYGFRATAALIAIKLWVLPEVKGPIRIAGDAEGVLADLVQLRGKSPAVSEVAKEVALHLAPQGRDLAGLHI